MINFGDLLLFVLIDKNINIADIIEKRKINGVWNIFALTKIITKI